MHAKPSCGIGDVGETGTPFGLPLLAHSGIGVSAMKVRGNSLALLTSFSRIAEEEVENQGNGFSCECCVLVSSRNIIMRELAPQFHIPWSIPTEAEDIPIVPTTSGTM